MQISSLLWLLAASGVQATAKVVNLGYAEYQSDLELDPGVTSFLGIRYAAPPTGDLRFQAPQAPATVVGVQNATTQPHQCWQQFLEGAMGQAITNPFASTPAAPRRPHELLSERDVGEVAGEGLVDEDCLFLDVHVPTTPASTALLPVIVYIHGGGYDAGNVSVYPAEDFVQLTNGSVVAVELQYRLGVFGFLAGSEVKAGGALNAGLLDQTFALQWVQKYISLFGGDPTKVTIWGQSAGAGSVLQHIVANGGATTPPLFRATMMNSPFLPLQYNYDDPIPEKVYSEVVSYVGCGSSATTLDCLRTVNASKLLAADSAIGLAGFMGTYTFVPVVDGTLIVERPYETLSKGKVNGDALLVSSNSNEGLIFTFPTLIEDNNVTLPEYIAGLMPRMNASSVQQAVALYEGLGSDVAAQAEVVMSDTIFVCPAFITVGASGANGYKAFFAIPPGTHAEDLSYEFINFPVPATFTNPQFLSSWRQAFMSTAINLTPNDAHATIAPTWPAWLTNKQEMLFNQTTTDEPVVKLTTTSASQIQRCEFWLSLGPVNNQ